MSLPLCRLLFTLVLPLSVNAAIETWTPNGTPIKAECLGVKGDYVVFKKTDGTRMLVPYDKLSPTDQARVSGLEFKTGNNTVTIAPADSGSADAVSKIATALRGKLVRLNGRALGEVAPDQLAGTKMYAIYYSASWCGPCRRFTPDLVAAYPEIKAKHPEFELIFVSNDRDEDSMRRYMIEDKMPWLGLRFKESETNPTLNRYQASGIPNLVFIDGNGRILSKSYEGGQYVGPRKVLADIRKHFKM
jgi:nucleoredoxin